jgi:multidrug efflux pump subunit AcrB
MWLVNAALKRPHTVWVGMLLVAVLGLMAYFRTPTDILPTLKVPVVVVFASYRGMPAPDMERTVVSILERSLTRCDHLEHIESRSLLGIGIIRVYFRPEADADVAASQVISLVNAEMQNLPPGMLPPSILKYDATAIPVGDLIISSADRDDKELLDLADHGIRDELAGIEGLASAPVFGGVFRQVQIYVHPRTLEALNLSPMDVARIVNSQSQVIPTGEIRIGEQNYYVSSNSMVSSPEDFQKIPLWTDGRKVVYLGDVAQIVDGQRWRTNTVRVDGKRAVYMPLLRQAGASAVRVVDNVRDFLPELHARGTVPEDVNLEIAFDQSQYVRDGMDNLFLEGLMGAVLSSLVVLLFLGSLRSTWIVALAIPLSGLCAFAGLYFLGFTINIMTLGGIALVVGRVVDDSIVDVENTVRHLSMGKTPMQAALDSAIEIAVPVLMATITTIVVFLPITFMTGMGKFLFTPLAAAATLALVASYFVSRTVSPLCCSKFLRAHEEARRFPRLLFVVGLLTLAIGTAVWLAGPKLPILWARVPLLGRRALNGLHWGGMGAAFLGGLIVLLALVNGISPLFERLFRVFASGYEWVLRLFLRRRIAVIAVLLVLLIPTVLAYRQIGQELFPAVDSSEFIVHMRSTGGPRVEETERQIAKVERLVREVVPEEDLGVILSNIGISSRWSAIYTPNNGPHAAFVKVQLRSGFAGRTRTTPEYVEELRQRLERESDLTANDFFFETGGMIRQILNAGAVAPIEVQVRGSSHEDRRRVINQLDSAIGKLRGVDETYQPQGITLPQLRIDVDRVRARLVNLTEADVIRNVIVALMSSAQIAPNFWIDPRTGNPYFIGVQYPEEAVENIQTLETIPVTPERGGGPPVKPRQLKEVANIERTQAPVEIFHSNAGRVSQLFVNVSDQDLARVAADVGQVIKDTPVPAGIRVTVAGEARSMSDSFRNMAFSLVLAVLLVYLVMAAQFQSWLDPLIMIVSAPLGLIGVMAMLWLTGTSLNIQSAMGVLMMVGIAVSNAVLMVEFANRQREAGLAAREAVLTAARTRLRPVLMTTLATILALLPMGVHLQPGDEMNLPLARAVIGGLAGSTLLTLLVVPVLYTLLKRPALPRPQAS